MSSPSTVATHYWAWDGASETRSGNAADFKLRSPGLIHTDGHEIHQRWGIFPVNNGCTFSQKNGCTWVVNHVFLSYTEKSVTIKNIIFWVVSI